MDAPLNISYKPQKKDPDLRKVDLLVLSDIHLGTYGCHAKELLRYLKSVNPRRVILNGDIIDIWQFRKRYWPTSHMKIVKKIMKWITEGVQVDYITGNHDEMLRKFVGFELGSFRIRNKLVLNLDGRRAWFFHGDVFDVVMQNSKWLAKLGAIGYDTLILINRFVNWSLEKVGKEKISLSKRVKNSVKSAVKFISNFEETAAQIAIENKFDYVVCGHIHQPVIKEFDESDGKVIYLNSGDWIENLTALEYTCGEWKIMNYKSEGEETEDNEEIEVSSSKELFGMMISEFDKIGKTKSV